MSRLFVSLVFSWSMVLSAQHPYYLEALEEARAAYRSGEWKVAAEQLEVAAFGLRETDPRQAEIHVLGALVHERLSRDREARDLATRALGYMSDPPQAPARISAEDWTRFRLLAGLAVVKPPVSQTVAERNPEEAAVDRLLAALRDDAGNLDLRFALIDAYLEMGKIRRAQRHLTIASRQGTDSIAYAEAYAKLYYLDGKFAGVVETFAGKAELSPVIRRYLGLSYRALGEEAAADALLGEESSRVEGRAPDLAPGSVAPVVPPEVMLPADEPGAVARIASFVATDDWARARELVVLAVTRWPRSQPIAYFQGRLYLHDQSYGKAAEIFYRLASSGYVERETFFYGGLANYHAGDYSMANYFWKRALEQGTGFEAEIERLRQTYRKRKALAGN